MRRLIVVFNLIEQIVGLFGELVAVAIIAVLRFVIPFDDAVASTLYAAGEVIRESFALTTVGEVSGGCPAAAPMSTPRKKFPFEHLDIILVRLEINICMNSVKVRLFLDYTLYL